MSKKKKKKLEQQQAESVQSKDEPTKEEKKPRKRKGLFKYYVKEKMDYQKYYKEDGKFDLEGYEWAGDSERVSEFITVVLMAIFFGYAIWSFYNSWIIYYGWYQAHKEGLTEFWHIFGDYIWIGILILVGIYLITLWISYMVVKWFGKLSAWFIYGSAILQIAVFSYLIYYFQDWDYWWIFIIPMAIQILLLTVWRKKLKLAVEYVKMSSLAVWKERKLLIPQFTQTIWIVIFSICEIIVTMATFLDFNNIDPITLSIGQKSVTITESWIYAGYTFLFVLLCYIFIYSSLGIKMLMIHHWYRGGSLEYWKALQMMRRRRQAIITYASYSSIIHIIQFFYKLFKGEIKPESLLDAYKLTTDLAPSAPTSLDAEQGKKDGNPLTLDVKHMKIKKKKKKKIPLHERIWMGLNYFTLPSIAIEDKIFIKAVWQSLKMLKSNIVDIYIKRSHVNKLFRLMQYAAIAVSGIVGAFLAGLVGRYVWGYYPGPTLYAIMAVGCVLFLWIAGSTSVIVINDLNLTYITLMFIHALDEKYGKQGYTRFELEKREKIEAKLIKKQQKKELKKQKKIEKLIKKGKIKPEDIQKNAKNQENIQTTTSNNVPKDSES
ncbi:MAG: hypothetical protein ACTSRZ_01875 [Promethearchaeota archaeon]